MDGEAEVTFEVRDFARGFVAALVEAGAVCLQPMNPQHRLGLYRVRAFLADETSRASEGAAREWFRSLVRIRNRVSPGMTGAFDQFQTDLRDLQLSLTESPNPSYEDINFSVSRPFALSLLDHLGSDQSDLVRKAARIFLGDETVSNGKRAA